MKGVQRAPGTPEKADRNIRTMIKAYIGRNLLDNEGFYPVLNSIDPAFHKAVEILKSGKSS
jgi:carboxyl-terminal processing protease